MAEPTTNAIELQIVTPERHVLQDTVQSVEVPGKEGYLGILPGHAPLITELGIGVLSYHKDSQVRFLTVINGYAEVLPHRVIVLAEVAERAEEIDVERTERARERAQSELARAGAGNEDWQHAETALQRALVRLQAASRAGAGAAGDGHA